MTIRFRLGLALALALLPILALGAFQSFSAFHRDAQLRQNTLVEAAGRTAAGARARFQASLALLTTLAVEPADAQCGQRLATAVQTLVGYDNLARVDAAGRTICSAKPVPAGLDRMKLPWFERLKGGATAAVARAALASQPSLLSAIPIRGAHGRFEGAVVAVMPLSSFRPDLSDASLPSGAAVALADADGRLLTESDPAAFGTPPTGWTSRALSKGGLLYRGRDRRGDFRDFAAAPLLSGDVFVILSAPAPGLLFWARLNPFASVVYPILAWLAAWAAVWIVSERVVIRWLAYLERIASIYAKGRFSVRPVQAESAPAEIRALAQTLDTMADGIVARDLSLRDSLAHKDALMREIHHRVKNNLQVITSLLNMQQRALSDPAARAAMSDTRQRISALALIYRALYQSPDLRRVDVRQFLEELIAQLMAGDGGRPLPIHTELQADDLEIDPDKLAPLALFAVEAITNARKHAFDQSGGVIRVRFTVAQGEVTLEIADDGRGDEEMLASTGVGRTLMSAFARQLRGRCEIELGASRGVVARLIFPAPEAGAGAGSDGAQVASHGNQAAA